MPDSNINIETVSKVAKNQEDQKRFNQLMNSWTEPSLEEMKVKLEKVGYKPGKRPFTDEEIIFMWNYDSTAFAKKFPGVAEYYMTVIDG